MIAGDSYDEPLALGPSPHYLAPPRQLVASDATIPNGPTGTRIVVPNTVYNYNYVACRNYAVTHCTAYNSAYCSWACGSYGDCANFASQCLYAGGEWSDATWYCTSTGCACGGSGLSGSSAWLNPAPLRSWLLATGRGSSMASIGQLGWGDIVSYDWGKNGTWDHVAVVVDSVNQTVAAHTNDYCNIVWHMGLQSTTNFQYTWINSTYSM